MQGGGRRAGAIVSTLASCNADIIALNEFRGTAPSQRISRKLDEIGYQSQISTAQKESPKENSLFVGSLKSLQLKQSPFLIEPHRFLLCEYENLLIGSIHVPNRGRGTKKEFLSQLLKFAESLSSYPAIIIGDTNTGEKGLDEESKFFNTFEDNWMKSMKSAGWYDGYRKINGDKRAFSWRHSSSSNGFRIDHIFATSKISINRARYEWFSMERLGSVSDHAALIVDLEILAI